MQIAQGTENTEEKPVQRPEVSTDAPSSNDATQVESEAATTTENTDGDEKKYALGSLCNYCTYCKVWRNQIEDIHFYSYRWNVLFDRHFDSQDHVHACSRDRQIKFPLSVNGFIFNF